MGASRSGTSAHVDVNWYQPRDEHGGLPCWRWRNKYHHASHALLPPNTGVLSALAERVRTWKSGRDHAALLDGSIRLRLTAHYNLGCAGITAWAERACRVCLAISRQASSCRMNSCGTAQYYGASKAIVSDCDVARRARLKKSLGEKLRTADAIDVIGKAMRH